MTLQNDVLLVGEVDLNGCEGHGCDEERRQEGHPKALGRGLFGEQAEEARGKRERG